MRYLLFYICCVLSIGVLHGQSQPASPLVQAFDQYLQLRESTKMALQWQSLGPVVNSARVEAVQVDHTKPGTMYVAFGSGNLWKTTNHGVSWNPIFNEMPSQGIGDIALAPSDPNVLYVGTGESLKKPRNFTMPGTGVYRSIDAGISWSHCGLDDAWHIGEIAVHPAKPEHLVVAVQGHFWSTNMHRGIFTSIDGGRTFDHTLFVSDSVGGNDVVFAPSYPHYVYASTWENYPGVSGKGSMVYRSTDAGMTWIACDNGLPKGAKVGRIGLAVSYQNPLKAYALVDNLSEKRTKAAQVFKTVDGGENWVKTHQDSLMIFPGIGWYFTDIYVNPKDDEEIFALGVRMAHSTNGGQSFELIQGDVRHVNESPAQRLHLDHCELWIHPDNEDMLALGNDGGFYLSYDKGASWTHFNNIPAGEFYDINLGPGRPYTIYGGTQDNATVFGPPRAWKPHQEDPWDYLWIDAWSGGDGCMTYVDPSDSNTIYFSLQHGAIRRRDMRTGKSVSIRPDFDEDCALEAIFNFVGPYMPSQHAVHVLFAAGNYVFRSTDRGDTWAAISPDLTLLDSIHNSKSIAAGAIAESPFHRGTLYVGMDHGEFFITTDEGTTWDERSEGLPSCYVRSICPSSHVDGRVYVALSGMNYDDLSGYIFVTEDNGMNWRSIKSNMPDAVVNVVLEDPVHPEVLYAGTLHGVYISVDSGKSWELLGKDLPSVSVADLAFHAESQDLIVATHGRGIYKMHVGPIHWQLSNPTSAHTTFLFQPQVARLPQMNDTHGEPIYSTASTIAFTFMLPKASPSTLSIYQDSLKIWSVEMDGRAGLNQYMWDLTKGSVDSPKPYFIHYDMFVEPGHYVLRLESSGTTHEGALEVRPFKD